MIFKWLLHGLLLNLKLAIKVEYVWIIDSTLFSGEIVNIGTNYIELDEDGKFRTDDDRFEFCDIRLEKNFPTQLYGYKIEGEYLYFEDKKLKAHNNIYYIKHDNPKASKLEIFKHGYVSEDKIKLKKVVL